MGKRIYERPQVSEEVFEANEYVASCSGSTWGVACSVDKANAVEAKLNNSKQSHSSAQCGLSSHQWITYSGAEGDRDSVAQTMTEIGTAGLGDLNCVLYTDASYSTPYDVTKVHPGDYIYWTTSSGDRVWHHQGTVYGHTNRS